MGQSKKNIAKDLLTSAVKKEIDDLLHREHKPQIDGEIDVVWVFSGPGTFVDPLKEEDPYWSSWMDRYRIIYGISLVKEVTAIKSQKQVPDITQSDVYNNGPYFIYNGTQEENEALKKVLYSGLSVLPKEKVIILDTFFGESGKEGIESTPDQIRSLTQERLDKKKILNKKIVLVSHAQHFPRILRYIEKYHPFPPYIKVEAFSLKPPKEYSDVYTQEEVEKVWEYFLKGDLAFNPARIESDRKD